MPVDGGNFVVSRQPGHWTDPATGIKVLGPHCVVDEVTREIIAYTDFPAPVQLPTTKMSADPKDLSEWSEIPFFDADSSNVHDGIWLAIQTGILEVVSDEAVKESYPDAFAKRRAYCFEPRSNARDKAKSESLLDMYERARDAHLSKAREANQTAHEDAERAAK
ncbi:MAG: hypothetical protein ACYDH5_16340 [Acidimicrobiales bacterium]